MRRLAGGRGWMTGAAALAVTFLTGLCSGQTNDALAPLQGGRLVIWIVTNTNDPHPLPAPGLQVAGVWNPQYQEQTAGSFGQTAGSVGQTVGSTGQTVGNFGQTAGSTGQTAGSTGQTAGSFGRNASSTGRNAGDAGTTMANFGVSTTNLAQAAASANTLTTYEHTPRRTRDWDAWVNEITSSFPGLKVVVDDVYRNDLETLLQTSVGTDSAPDVLVGSSLPQEWKRGEGALAERLGIGILWNVMRVAQNEDAGQRTGFSPEAVVLQAAPDHDQARAFALWVAERGEDDGTGMEPVPSAATLAAAATAERAVKSVLAAGTVSDADPDMARANAELWSAMLSGTGSAATGRVEVRTEPMAVGIHGGLAVAAVRAVGSGEHAFGVAHALVVLRMSSEGKWKVLEVLPSMSPQAQDRAFRTLTSFAGGGAALGNEGSAALVNEGPRPQGVTQASPKDGETRPPQPMLWWDNLGGASLQVVEWQQEFGNAWSAPNLYFVPDNNSRLRTQVVARFASAAGAYRWRVWSVGKGGNIVIGAWRTMNILGR